MSRTLLIEMFMGKFFETQLWARATISSICLVFSINKQHRTFAVNATSLALCYTENTKTLSIEHSI